MATHTRAFEESSPLTSKGHVTTSKSVGQADDPTIDSFPPLLARDIAAHPEHLKAFPKDLATHIARLVKDVPFDPDAPIEGDVAL